MLALSKFCYNHIRELRYIRTSSYDLKTGSISVITQNNQCNKATRFVCARKTLNK